jgi:hypothetical protein
MRVWSCLFSGDEMISDSYKINMIMDGQVLEAKGKYIQKSANE